MEIVKQAALNKLGKFTKADIMELCPTVGRASIENALKNLLKKTSSFATAADARRSIPKANNGFLIIAR